MTLEAVFSRWARADWKAHLQAADAEREAWINARLSMYPDEGTREWMRNQLESWLANSGKREESRRGA